MNLEINVLISRIYRTMQDVIEVQHKAMRIYTFVGIALIEKDDILEEMGCFFSALSEEKQNGYSKLLHLMAKFSQLRFNHTVPVCEQAIINLEENLDRERLESHPNRIFYNQLSNYENKEEPKPPERESVLRAVQFVMDLEQRLNQDLRKLYKLAANILDPKDPTNWMKPGTIAACRHHCEGMLDTNNTCKCKRFYSLTSELCDMLRTDFLEQEEKVLEEMQAHLDVVLNLVAQQEQDQDLPH